MAEQEHDKSEQATPFKLQEARRRGQVSKSLDMNSFVMISGLLLILVIWGEQFIHGVLALERSIFSQAHLVKFDPNDFSRWIAEVVFVVSDLLWPFLLASVLAAVIANMLQTGPIFSFFPVKPDVQRLNPVQGFKRVFSLRMLFEAAKSVIKLLLFGAVAYAMIANLFVGILNMASIHPYAYPAAWLDVTVELIFKLGLVLLLVALLDLIYSRLDFAKKMRMSKRELKEEVKRREGDPLIRQKIKELQRENLKRSKSVSRVPEADVLITNPTHYAIALQYERGKANAPVVIAKGSGELAQQMKAIAARHDVPVVEYPEVARSLFRSTEVGEAIPMALYPAVAKVFAEIMIASGDGIRVEVGT